MENSNFKLDKETMEILMNPLPKFIENSLADYRAQTEKKDKILIMQSMRDILPVKLSAYNPAIVKYFTEMIDLLDDKDIYEMVSLLIGEMCDYREQLQNDFVDRSIFSKLDYAYESSYYLVRALCASNERNFKIFHTQHYREERDGNDERIKELIECFKVNK